MIRKILSLIRRLKYSFNSKIKIGKDVHIGQGVKINAVSGANITIGNNCEINDSVTLFAQKGNISIGNHCVVDDHVHMAAMGESIIIANNCYINSFCFISGRGGLAIGNDVSIAPQTVIITDNHIFTDKNIPINSQGYEKRKVIIEDDVWIGAGCKILCGVNIGKGVVVGAGAVVTKSLESYGVYAGVPAKLIRKR